MSWEISDKPEVSGLSLFKATQRWLSTRRGYRVGCADTVEDASE